MFFSFSLFLPVILHFIKQSSTQEVLPSASSCVRDCAQYRVDGDFSSNTTDVYEQCLRNCDAGHSVESRTGHESANKNLPQASSDSPDQNCQAPPPPPATCNNSPAQVPDDAPQCVRACANFVVSQGNCRFFGGSFSGFFMAPFGQCLSARCGPADLAAGLRFTVTNGPFGKQMCPDVCNPGGRSLMPLASSSCTTATSAAATPTSPTTAPNATATGNTTSSMPSQPTSAPNSTNVGNTTNSTTTSRMPSQPTSAPNSTNTGNTTNNTMTSPMPSQPTSAPNSTNVGNNTNSTTTAPMPSQPTSAPNSTSTGNTTNNTATSPMPSQPTSAPNSTDVGNNTNSGTSSPMPPQPTSAPNSTSIGNTTNSTATSLSPSQPTAAPNSTANGNTTNSTTTSPMPSQPTSAPNSTSTEDPTNSTTFPGQSCDAPPVQGACKNAPAQVPDNAPQCVKLCANTVVQQGNCGYLGGSFSPFFTMPFGQCLRTRCGPDDVRVGLQFLVTNGPFGKQLCPAVCTSAGRRPMAFANGTCTANTSTPATPDNSTTGSNSTATGNNTSPMPPQPTSAPNSTDIGNTTNSTTTSPTPAQPTSAPNSTDVGNNTNSTTTSLSPSQPTSAPNSTDTGNTTNSTTTSPMPPQPTSAPNSTDIGDTINSTTTSSDPSLPVPTCKVRAGEVCHDSPAILPDDAPQCVKLCASILVQQGNCSSPGGSFSGAFLIPFGECLSARCGPDDVQAGLKLTENGPTAKQICPAACISAARRPMPFANGTDSGPSKCSPNASATANSTAASNSSAAGNNTSPMPAQPTSAPNSTDLGNTTNSTTTSPMPSQPTSAPNSTDLGNTTNSTTTSPMPSQPTSSPNSTDIGDTINSTTTSSDPSLPVPTCKVRAREVCDDSPAILPDNAPQCVKLCASIIVQQGNCSSPGGSFSESFSKPFGRCLRARCKPDDVLAGRRLTENGPTAKQICPAACISVARRRPMSFANGTDSGPSKCSSNSSATANSTAASNSTATGNNTSPMPAQPTSAPNSTDLGNTTNNTTTSPMPSQPTSAPNSTDVGNTTNSTTTSPMPSQPTSAPNSTDVGNTTSSTTTSSMPSQPTSAPNSTDAGNTTNSTTTSPMPPQPTSAPNSTDLDNTTSSTTTSSMPSQPTSAPSSTDAGNTTNSTATSSMPSQPTSAPNSTNIGNTTDSTTAPGPLQTSISVDPTSVPSSNIPVPTEAPSTLTSSTTTPTVSSAMPTPTGKVPGGGTPDQFSLVPENAPQCVKRCARRKVDEDYCRVPDVFSRAYLRCLKDHCNEKEVAIGQQFTNQICRSPASGGTGVPSPVAENAPGCVKRCARRKVEEKYCSQPDIFAKAYLQCLKDHCDEQEVKVGLQFTGQICRGASGATGYPSSVPDNAPQCVKNCARRKVEENYCNITPNVFAKAYLQCLKDHCKENEVKIGEKFTNQICPASRKLPLTRNRIARGIPRGFPENTLRHFFG